MPKEFLSTILCCLVASSTSKLEARPRRRLNGSTFWPDVSVPLPDLSLIDGEKPTSNFALMNGAIMGRSNLHCDGNRQAFATITDASLALGVSTRSSAFPNLGGVGCFSVSFWYRCIGHDASRRNDFQYLISTGVVPGTGQTGPYLHIVLPPHSKRPANSPRRLRILISSDPSPAANGDIDYIDINIPR